MDKWGLELEESEACIEYLIKERFIDEQRFTTYYVNDKFKFNNWGKIKIKHHLKQKGLPNTTIENALEEIDFNEYLVTLTELLQTKLKQIKNKDHWQTKAALARFAQSRGFEPHLVFQCINELNLGQ